MDNKVIDQINEKTDIIALVSSYVKLERRGKNYFGLCPFHDDTDPSMSVSPEKNIFKCFSCGEGGGPINFYQKINHTTFPEALAALGEPLGIKLNVERKAQIKTVAEHDILREVSKFYEYTLNNSKLGEEALKYLKGRNLSDEVIKHFQIGLSPKNNAIYKLLKSKNFTEEQMLDSGMVNLKNDEYRDFFNERIMFPITNIQGNIVGFSGRALGKATPKYYNSSDSKIFNKSETLYHIHEALGDIRKLGYVIIHEGFFDCISSYSAGVKNTVATMGTALTLAHAKILENYTKRVILAFDGDVAGVNAAIKAIEVFKQTKLRIDVLKIKDGLDPDDYIKKYGKESYLSLYKKNLTDQYEFIYNATKENLNLANANDASILKNATKSMLAGASNAIKEKYLKRLSDDLNVSVSSISGEVLKQQKQPVLKKEVKSQRKNELPEKFYKAEKQLLLSMFKDKEVARRIEQSLGPNYVCDLRTLEIRSILQYEYYKEHDEFDKEVFISYVEKKDDAEELKALLKEIFTSLDYTQKFVFTEEEIKEQIEVVKGVNEEKERIELKKDVINEPESYQKTIKIEKLKKNIIKRKKHNIE